MKIRFLILRQRILRYYWLNLFWILDGNILRKENSFKFFTGAPRWLGKGEMVEMACQLG